MGQALIHGISIGLLICVLVGPVFFAMLGIAIYYSKRAAIWFAMGMLLSDILYAALSYGGVSAILFSGPMKLRMHILGGVVFVFMGGRMIQQTLARHVQQKIETNLSEHPRWTHFIGQGFLTNTLNPAVFFLWVGIVGTSPHYHRISTTLLFFLAIFCTTFGTDLLKITIADSLKKFLHGKNLTIVQMVTGCILIGLGIFVSLKAILRF